MASTLGCQNELLVSLYGWHSKHSTDIGCSSILFDHLLNSTKINLYLFQTVSCSDVQNIPLELATLHSIFQSLFCIMSHPVGFCKEMLGKIFATVVKELTLGDWIELYGGSKNFESFICVLSHVYIFKVLHQCSSDYLQLDILSYFYFVSIASPRFERHLQIFINSIIVRLIMH